MKLCNKTRLLSAAAALTIAFSCFALTACSSNSAPASEASSETLAATVAVNGTCGESVLWELDNGTLTLSGSGRMANYTAQDPAPWADLKDEITAVEVEGTVTSVGAAAFKDCVNLTVVNIAEGVEYIESAAFNGCTALAEANIPESVTYIKLGAFKNCTALTEVTIRGNCRLDMNVFPENVTVNRYN